MNDKDAEKNVPQILTNDAGNAIDPTVVIEDADRTVVLTEDETIVIEKQHLIDVAPKNRPRKVYGGMWGPIEIATAGAGMLAIIASLLLYVLVVMPSNRELESNRLRMASLETEVRAAKDKYGDISNTQTAVANLLSSVDSFEGRYLPIAATGRTALYQRINSLIASYGLVNTTGPDFTPLEIVDSSKSGQKDEERGKAKFQSIFPGVYVTTTLEGPYLNLRRFIREIETGNEFVVVSSVELEPSDTEQKSDERSNQARTGVPGVSYDPTRTSSGLPSNTGVRVQSPSQPAQQLGSSGGKTHGTTVRLRLEMAAYFRRPNVETSIEPEAVAR